MNLKSGDIILLNSGKRSLVIENMEIISVSSYIKYVRARYLNKNGSYNPKNKSIHLVENTSGYSDGVNFFRIKKVGKMRKTYV